MLWRVWLTVTNTNPHAGWVTLGLSKQETHSLIPQSHNWSLNGCQWDISWWQFDISESEISADVNAIRRILVIVSKILADANGISAEYQWNWWNISNVVANTISVVTKIVGFFLLRETISFVRKPIEKLRTILGKSLLFFTKVTHLLVKLMHSFAKVSHLFAKVMRLLGGKFFLHTKILQFVCVWLC